MSNPRDITPPGEAPSDPNDKGIDALGFALERLRCQLLWIDEHREEFLKHRNTDAVLAQQELTYLAHSITQAKRHFIRLSELLLAGYTFDPAKKNPMADQSDADFWRRHLGDSSSQET